LLKKPRALNRKDNPKALSDKQFAMTPAEGLRIHKGKFVGINLDAAFGVMASPQQSFFGHKSILFHGICAWVKSSRTRSMARKAVAKATARHVAIAETEVGERIAALRGASKGTPAGKIGPQRRLAIAAIGHLLALSDEKYRPLYVQIYLQIGGMTAVTDAYKRPAKHHTTKTDKKRARPKQESGIRELVKLATILDYHARELSADPEQYGKPSISKAASLWDSSIEDRQKARARGLFALGKAQVNELLAEHRPAFALLYSADRVLVAEGRSLLDCLLETKPSQDVIVPHILEWLSYTKYFSENVLKTMKGDWAKTYSPLATSIEVRQPVLPNLGDDDIREIKRAFATSKSEARLQFRRN
jgi:hypothetical protein